MNQKPLPIGIDDFKKIIEGGYYYVDKSLFIKELLISKAEVTLIPRPRRFGKTLNLSMLRYFFEKTQKSHAHLFENLAIANHAHFMTHQGQYPVIYITFKDVKWDTWETTFDAIKAVITDEYRRNNYLLESNILLPSEKVDFEKIITKTASLQEYAQALKQLSDFLCRFHNKKTYIFIDEYDAPIHAGFLHAFYDKIIIFMRNFLCGGFKGNSNLEHGVITGILRVARESIFSGMNNLEVRTLLNNDYATIFGLVEQEVNDIIAEFRPHASLDEVRAWYDGYTSGTTKIYNPWSIINFAKEGKLKPYWVNTSDNLLIRSLIENSHVDQKKDIEYIMTGESISVQLHENIVFQDLDKKPYSLLNFLLFTGYLTYDSPYEKDLLSYAHFSIPNNEIMSLYKTIILDWFSERISITYYQHMLSHLTAGNVEDFIDFFKTIVAQSLSTLDVAENEPEKFYHALVLGMLVSIHTTHIIKSNRESGLGRYDVMIIPRDMTKLGIIIEFKKVDHDKHETLTSAAKKALVQIENKKYEAELQQYGVKKILKLAIVFDGKQTLVLQA